MYHKRSLHGVVCKNKPYQCKLETAKMIGLYKEAEPNVWLFQKAASPELLIFHLTFPLTLKKLSHPPQSQK